MLSSICRLCSECEGVIPIFQFADDLNLSSKIMYCCNKSKINVEWTDSLPKFICHNCHYQLDKSYKFILQCESADAKLRLSQLKNDTSNLLSDDDPCPLNQNNFKSEFKFNSDDSVNDNPNFINNKKTNIIRSQDQNSTNLYDNTENGIPNVRAKIKTRKNNVHCFNCATCGKICLSNSSLVAHMRSHTDERSFKCLNCSKTFKDPSGLKRHVDNNHTENRSRNFTCDDCGKCFFTKLCLTVHKRIHTGETPYACNFCPAHFAQSGSLIRHNRRHTGEKPYQCMICKKAFCSKTELNVHSKVHSQHKKFSCDICNVKFKHKSTFNKHLLQHTHNLLYVCDICGNTFNAKSNLALHISRRHSPESGFCEICSNYASNIEKHMWKHNGYRGLKCDYCSSAFFNKRGLVQHMSRRHSGNQYKCLESSCNETFPMKKMLNYHMIKFHSSVVPYPCNKCSRKFYRKNDYVRHKLGTHKEGD